MTHLFKFEMYAYDGAKATGEVKAADVEAAKAWVRDQYPEAMSISVTMVAPEGEAAAVKRYWMGTAPEKCDACGENTNGVFYDAKTATGQWGILCDCCHTNGPGLGLLGTGLGQKYVRQEDGRYLKTAG